MENKNYIRFICKTLVLFVFALMVNPDVAISQSCPSTCGTSMTINSNGNFGQNANSNCQEDGTMNQNCAEFVFDDFAGKTVTFDAGNGQECKGQGANNIYEFIDGTTCNMLGNGTVTGVVVPITATTYSVFVCRNGSGLVNVCNVEGINPCEPSILCPTDQLGLACDATIPTDAAAMFAAYGGLVNDCEATVTYSFVDGFERPGKCGGSDQVTILVELTTDGGTTELGRCTFTIELDPAEVPVLTVPPYASSVTCADASQIIFAPATYTNNANDQDCLIMGSLNPVIAPDYDHCGGTITVSYEGADECGNPLSATRTINVDPAPAPTITVPYPMTVISCDMVDQFMPTNATATYSNNQMGDCSVSGTIIPHVDKDVRDCGGFITLKYSIPHHDRCEGLTYIDVKKTITIIDNVPPVLEVPGPLTLSCDDISETVSAAFRIAQFLDRAVATDNCDTDPVITYTGAQNIDICAGGSFPITWTAKDACGNEATLGSTITITPDETGPVVTPPANITVSCADISETVDPSGVIAQFLDAATATDNCDTDPVITYSGAANLNICAGGTQTITWTATDACGRTGTATASITIIQDDQAPVVTPPADITLDCDDISETDDPSAIVAQFLDAATAIDNCDTDPVITYTGAEHFDICASQTTVTTITWSATDACGLTGTATATITLIPDTERPVLQTGPADLTVNLDVNCEFIIPDYTADARTIFTDNCDTDVVVKQTPAPNSMSLFEHNSSQLITLTGTDACGNVSLPHTFTVTVVDITKPFIALSGSTDVDVESCEDSQVVYYTIKLEDNCLRFDDPTLQTVTIQMPGVIDQTGIPSNPYTFALDLNPDDDGKLVVSYTDAGGNNCTNELNIIIDKDADACDVQFGDCQCEGITDEGTKWFSDIISLDSWEDHEWTVAISQGLYLDRDLTLPLLAGTPLKSDNNTANNTEEVETFFIDLNNDQVADKLYHVSGEAYSLMVVNQYQHVGGVEFMGNVCFYPELEIIEQEEEYCYGSTLETLVFGADEMGEFTIDPSTTAHVVDTRLNATRDTFEVDINPNKTVGYQNFGEYFVKVNFEGDGIDVNGQKRPGCPVMITAYFDILEFKLTCNDDVTVNLDNSQHCGVNIIPDMLIENECSVNDAIYKIRILDPKGQIDDIEGNNSNNVMLHGVTPGVYLYSIRVDAIKDSCWGYITIEDKLKPVCLLDYKNGHFAPYDKEPAIDGLCKEHVYTDDPSGYDDLAPELVSCTVDEDGGLEAIEPWFDKLEIKDNPRTGEEADFADCSELTGIHTFTHSIDGCDYDYSLPLRKLAKYQLIHKEDVPKGWALHKVYIRGTFASDIHGNVSDTCYQLVGVIKPSAKNIRLDKEVLTECGESKPYAGSPNPYFYDAENTRTDIAPPALGKSSARDDGEYEGPGRLTSGFYFTCDPGKKIEIGNGEHKCGFAASYHADPAIDVCGGQKQAVHWTVIDWCGDQRRAVIYDEFTQIRKTEDSRKPVKNDPLSYSFNEAPFDCEGTLIIEPLWTQDCSDVTVSMVVDYSTTGHTTGSFGRTVLGNGGSVKVHNTAYGKIVVTATDACGNSDSWTEDFGPHGDISAPICIVNDELIVSMVSFEKADGSHGLGARVKPEDLDDTSHDNCSGIASYEVRRVGSTTWGPYVDFTEADINLETCDAATYQVELRVTDNAGNSSICWSNITLEDKSLSCDVDAFKVGDCWSVGEFDTPTVWGYCYTTSESESTVAEYHCPTSLSLAQLAALGIPSSARISAEYGDILSIRKKTWTYTKKSAHGDKVVSCSQYLYETYKSGKVGFAFPMDAKFDCGSDASIPEPATLEDIMVNESCDQWAMNMDEQRFYGEDDDACAKIIRTYTFINWCSQDVDNRIADGRIPIVNKANDVRVDIWGERAERRDAWGQFLGYSPTDVNGDGKLIAADGDKQVIISSEYDQEPLNGVFKYIQVIKFNDNVAPLLDVAAEYTCATTGDCDPHGNLEITINADDECGGDVHLTKVDLVEPSGKSVDITNLLSTDGDVYQLNVTIGDNKLAGELGLAPGTYGINVKVADGCGNFNTKSTSFTVTDECKKPTPVGVATWNVTMESGCITLWASDLDISSYDNCGVTKVFVSKYPDPETANEGVTYCCADGELGTQTAYLFVFDAAGNYNYVEIPVVIQSTGEECDEVESAALVGNITNEGGEDIDEVMVNVSGNGMNPIAQLFDGRFNINVPMSSDVTISTEKNINHDNGVSTADLVMLQRHILGITPLSSAYQFIAADASNDQKVDTRDILHISRLILGITAEYKDNSSWRFVDANHTFNNPAQPWGFPEAVDFQNLDASKQADFVGVKIGDLTGNARPNQLLGNGEQVGPENMVIAIEDASIAAGESHTIEFTTQAFDFAGYQFSIELSNAVSFVSLQPVLTGMNEANFGLTNLENGIITTAYATADAQVLENGTTLFSITVKANETINVSDVIAINSTVTSAEAYNEELEIFGVEALYNTLSGAFELFQNVPNPVVNETVIGFSLPQASEATLKVFDVSGRTLKVITNDFAKGYNEVTVSKSELGAAGVLYYQLDTESDSATKKMVIIE